MNVNCEGPTVGQYRVDVLKTVSNWRPEPQAGGLPKWRKSTLDGISAIMSQKYWYRTSERLEGELEFSSFICEFPPPRSTSSEFHKGGYLRCCSHRLYRRKQKDEQHLQSQSGHRLPSSAIQLMLELDPTNVVMDIMIFCTNSVANGTRTIYMSSDFKQASTRGRWMSTAYSPRA
jgi:hypothetical protein